MAETKTITLAKALKLKNRLAGRVTKLTTDIQTYNSVQQGAESVDVRAEYEQRTELVARLTALKYAIFRANLPVQKTIFELAERKAEVALLTELPTKHGTYKEGYPTAGEVTYVAHLRKAEVDELVARLENEIDRLQDQLDGFNLETRIEVDPGTIAAAAD
jgi:hypothetical protein